MEKRSYYVLGVMSGTSLDGIDFCYARISLGETFDFEIHKADTIPYSSYWVQKLTSVVTLSMNDLDEFNDEYTRYLADSINTFISKNSIHVIDAVCSHGHTVFHQPQEGITLQIGNLPILAKLIQHRIVCDFRPEDVALGGQGAPLVPIGDRLLFGEYDYCLNLGGFANISFEYDAQRLAFDVCPVNIVMNHYTRNVGLDFDDKGSLARMGTLNQELLDELNALDYYRKSYPKSLGIEWVNEHVFPMIDSYSMDVNDILRTFVEHIATQISLSLNSKSGTLLITGGGAYNTFLIEMIKNKTTTQVVIPSDEVVNFKEALVFGLLGVLKLNGQINCLASVTGASRDHSSGKIFLP